MQTEVAELNFRRFHAKMKSVLERAGLPLDVQALPKGLNTLRGSALAQEISNNWRDYIPAERREILRFAINQQVYDEAEGLILEQGYEDLKQAIEADVNPKVLIGNCLADLCKGIEAEAVIDNELHTRLYFRFENLDSESELRMLAEEVIQSEPLEKQTLSPRFNLASIEIEDIQYQAYVTSSSESDFSIILESEILPVVPFPKTDSNSPAKAEGSALRVSDKKAERIELALKRISAELDAEKPNVYKLLELQKIFVAAIVAIYFPNLENTRNQADMFFYKALENSGVLTPGQLEQLREINKIRNLIAHYPMDELPEFTRDEVVSNAEFFSSLLNSL